MMKREKNDAIAKRAELSKKLTKTRSTSMNVLVSSQQKYLSDESNRRMAEDSNTMAALASVVIRSRGEYDDAHKDVVERIKNAGEKIELGKEEVQNVVAIIDPFISTPQDEPVSAQKIFAKNDQYTLLKLPSLKAKLSLKSVLDACRQAVALGQAIGNLKPTFESVAVLLLNLGQVIYYLDTQLKHEMDSNETVLLKIIIERTLCGRRDVDEDSIVKEYMKIVADRNQPESNSDGTVRKIIETFENTYRIIDIANGKISFVEDVSFT